MGNNRQRRLIELGKDILILLLACSAIYLGANTVLARQLSGFLQENHSPTASQSGEWQQSSVAWPVRMAVSNWNGESMIRRGEQYDQAACEMLFQPAAGLLRESLSSLGPAQTVTEQEWRGVLSGTSNLYFDFLGQIPLSVLSGWLSGRDNGLDGTVRRLALSAEGEQVTLYYRDEETGSYCARQAGVVNIEQLNSAVQGIMDNGAAFAFELEQYSGLDGDTMLLQEQPQPRVYSAVNPLLSEGQGEETNSEGRLGELLTALSFPDSSYIYPGTGQVIRSGYETLRVYADGMVKYDVTEGEQSRYAIPAQGEELTAFEVAEACRQLADSTAGAMAGEARLYLREIYQTENGWEVDFGYCLDGAHVQVGQEGYAAHFQVQNNEITQFILQLRCYTDTESRSIVLPEQQAMAAMQAMDKQGGELILVYRDMGADTVSAGWVTD